MSKSTAFPSRSKLTICFAHAAYQMADRFLARDTGLRHFQVREAADLEARIGEADVVVASMMWKNHLLAKAPRLRFIQSISAGIDQYDKALLAERSVRLANAAGVNANAVAEHAMALTLALMRQVHTGRDNQTAKVWRPMISEIAKREDELAGKTMVVVGAGRIGARLVQLAKAFDLRVLAVRRDAAQGVAGADAVYPTTRLPELIATADILVLACPLTAETENLVDGRLLAQMKPTAMVINVARGKVVDEAALIAALRDKRIACAGLDVTREEPLPQASPLWTMPNVLITPHTAGETQRYEDRVIDLLLENLDRLWRGETQLVNQII